MTFVFFGSSEFSVYVLDELKLDNLVPDLIITTPDKPKGRKLILTPTPVKVWAKQNNIEVLDPPSLKKKDSDLVSKLETQNSDFFLVASYGKIIPAEIFNIPKYKTLNIHPSLLPKYRGASPIQSQILNDEKNIGVTIIQIEEKMDAGPILTHKKISIPPQQSQKCTDIFLLKNSSCSAQSASQGISEAVASEIHRIPSRIELEKILATEGAKLFAEILPDWLDGKMELKTQKETEATFCKKIEKKDGEINLEDNSYKNFLKIKAYEGWPGTYFFDKNGKRIKITEAKFEDNQLKILKVIPEGKKEILFSPKSFN